jgi:putative addiction module component (TIGR02574 family)
MTTVDRLVEEARQLSPEERAELVERLCQIEPEIDPEWAAAWAEEARRRNDEIESGAVDTVPWETVRERMHERIRGARD